MRFYQFSTFMFLVTLLACNNNTHEEKQSLKLWYQQPAEKWTEALPIGNGRLGGMVFGGIEQERLQFNEETLWTGAPRSYYREGASEYLPEIRALLFAGKQEEAEALAAREFMGRKSHEDEYEGLVETWLSEVRSLENSPVNPANPDADDSSWELMDIPTEDGWRDRGHEGLDGAVWFRTDFDLPEEWKGEDLVLELGRIRDQDFTYFNGKQVGSINDKGKERIYKIAAPLLQAGKNVIAVQVINYSDKGGFVGLRDENEPMSIYPEGQKEKGISLSKVWKYKIQDYNPPTFPQYMASYQPFGDLIVNFDGHKNADQYRRALDISNAVMTTSYKVDGVKYTREYFASEPHQVIAMHMTASEPGMLSFEASLTSLHLGFITKKIDEATLGLSVKVRTGDLKGESYLRITTSDGDVTVSEDKIILENATEATLYLTAGTSYINYKDISGAPARACIAALEKVNNQPYEKIKTAHTQDYRRYLDTFSINFGASHYDTIPTDQRIKNFAENEDPAFAALYMQYGRYLMLSSSRPGTRPANLQGIWNELLSPPWGSKYTCNINVEMNYWPAEVLNLSACHEPLFKMIEELSEEGRNTAKAHYDCAGWVSHHNTDLWRGTAPVNASNHGIWVTGGAWLSQHLWEHYLFTQDSVFLAERAYPVMKEAARFFVDFLIEDPKTGWLISTPSNSPETGGLVAGPTMDHQIIRSLFKSCIAASGKLGVDQAFSDTLQKKYDRIAPNQIGQYGQLQEWLEDVDDPENKHRHVSHLWGVHPGTEINWRDTPELFDAAKQSLIFRGDAGTGWSLAWKINFWARFRDGDHAYELVKKMLSPVNESDSDLGGAAYPNLFDAHPPFQIDGNFGGAAGIAEMLVQSHLGMIEIFPALPSALEEGEVKGLCTRGGFELNMKWKEGKLENLEVLSKAGKKCSIKYGDREITFDTDKGEVYQLNEDLKQI